MQKEYLGAIALAVYILSVYAIAAVKLIGGHS